MIHYITGLGQVWIGSKPPLNQAYNVLWLKPSDTKEFWELRIFNQSKNSWDLVITASADKELVERVEALEEEQSALSEEQKALSLKITNLEGSISILEEDTLKNEDILQEEGNNLDKVISQDAITKILQQLRSSIPDLNAHNTSSSSHEDIRTLIENNTQNINTNTTNIEKSVVLPTFNSEENSLTFNTQGGDVLKVSLASSNYLEVSNFKEATKQIASLYPVGTIINVNIPEDATDSPLPSYKLVGHAYVVMNSSPGEANTSAAVRWELYSTINPEIIYLGMTTLIATVVVVKWYKSNTNDIIKITDFEDYSWVNGRSVGDTVFIYADGSLGSIKNAPIKDNGSQYSFYVGIAQFSAGTTIIPVITYTITAFALGSAIAAPSKIYIGELSLGTGRPILTWLDMSVSTPALKITNYNEVGKNFDQYPYNCKISIYSDETTVNPPISGKWCTGYVYKKSGAEYWYFVYTDKLETRFLTPYQGWYDYTTGTVQWMSLKDIINTE